MKAFLLFASLSFASAIMLVPHNGNETRPGVYNAVLPENFTINKNFTNDINTKPRPHLAIVESRKLFDNEDAYEYEDAAAETVVDENYDDNANLDSDDIAEGDEDVQNNNGSRRLLRRSKAASAPAPAPKAAPSRPDHHKSGPKAPCQPRRCIRTRDTRLRVAGKDWPRQHLFGFQGSPNRRRSYGRPQDHAQSGCPSCFRE